MTNVINMIDDRFKHDILQAISDISVRHGNDNGLEEAINILTAYENSLYEALTLNNERD